MMDGRHDHFQRHREGSKGFTVCGGCGERSERGLESHELDDWEYKHTHTVRTGTGSGTARLATSVKHYRACAEDTRYTQRERALWLQLAEEAERHIRQKSEEIPGQMGLFD